MLSREEVFQGRNAQEASSPFFFSLVSSSLQKECVQEEMGRFGSSPDYCVHANQSSGDECSEVEL